MTCRGNIPEIQSMEGCPCDLRDFPGAMRIMAGLSSIPRQTGNFSEFRQAMLAGIRSKDPLLSWHAREGNDLGLMLIEMWAYICDSISFYDQVIANECYLRTAVQRDSVKKIASLLGYLPRPAVASVAYLAAIAEGNLPITIPAGTVFRSGSFDGNPPQVFETSRDLNIHPYTSKWLINPHIPDTLTEKNPLTLLVKPQNVINPGMHVLLYNSRNMDQSRILKVKEVAPFTTRNNISCIEVFLEDGVKFTEKTLLSNLTLLYPRQTARIIDYKSSTLILDKLYPGFADGDKILISMGRDYRWFKITGKPDTHDIKASPDTSVTINGSAYVIKGNMISATKITIDRAINETLEKVPEFQPWHITDSSELLLHFDMITAGTIINDADPGIGVLSEVTLKSPNDLLPAGFKPEHFIILDKNNTGYEVMAQLQNNPASLLINTDSPWKGPLDLPADAYGNILEVSRGETVRQEILGSGDASVAGQTFKLKKKPLTYLFSATSKSHQAIKSVLEVRVNGKLWKEVPAFFNALPSDQIYIVRQDEEGESYITFGDGTSGQRLPTGIDNIVANYRYGGGKISPPAGSITQIAKPVKGLKNVLNPVAAAGGDDPETIENMRSAVPKTSVLLGQIVSIRDVEAVVSNIPGVRGFEVEWNWCKTMQSPMVHVYFIGAESLCSFIVSRLSSLSEPNMTYQVQKALSIPVMVNIDLSVDPAFSPDDVISDAGKLLLNSSDGILSPERIGIGKPLFRSRIYKVLTSVEGVLGAGNISWNGEPFIEFAKRPDPGCYFDLESGGLFINGIRIYP
jgi:hypothetical protein